MRLKLKGTEFCIPTPEIVKVEYTVELQTIREECEKHGIVWDAGNLTECLVMITLVGNTASTGTMEKV